MKIVCSALLLACLLVMGGCGSGVPEGAGDHSVPIPDTHVVSWSGYAAEYRAAGKGLVMPQGETFPQDPPMAPGSSGNWQKGAGSSDAFLTWNCAWGRAALESASGSDAKTHALNMYAKIRTTPAWQTTFDDHGRSIISDAIDSALLGDETRLSSIISGLCRP